MGFKEEIKREMRNVKHDIALTIDRKFSVSYEGMDIEVHNELLRETLTVNGETLDQMNRKSIWSHIIPVSYLKGTYIDRDGRKRKIKVSLGGLITLHVKVKVDGKLILHEKMKFVMNPWDNKTAIAPFIEQQAATGVIAAALPDDYMLVNDGEAPLAPGYGDQSFAIPVSQGYVKKVVKLLQEQLNNPSVETRKATYEKLLEERVIDYLELFMYEMSETELDKNKLAQEATWFLDHATHREVVKFAIALFGFTDAKDVHPRLEKLSLHEEFTGSALFALQNSHALKNDFVLNLCKTLRGWGKVAAFDFLDAHNDDIRHWLLTDAVEHSDAPEYIARYCIEKGKLDVVLHEKEVSEEIYVGAEKLLRAYIDHDRLSSLDSYEYMGQILQRFVHHAKKYAKSFDQFYTIAAIAQYMKMDEDEWENLYETSWKPFQRNMVEEGIAEIAKSLDYRDEAYAKLEGNDHETWQALTILHYYKIDVSERVAKMLQANPERLALYDYVLHSQNVNAIAQVASIASAHFDLNHLQDEAFETTLLRLIYSLSEYDGTSKPLLANALQSTVESFQFEALQTLSQWEKESWQDLQPLVATLSTQSADKDVRKLAKEILA